MKIGAGLAETQAARSRIAGSTGVKMAEKMERTERGEPAAASVSAPDRARTLLLAAGIGFLFVCMVLPLVGKAAAMTGWFARNERAFVVVLAAETVLCVLALAAGLRRRASAGGSFPRAAAWLVGVCLFLMGAFLAGWLKV